MTNKIFKQYIGTLENFKAWLAKDNNSVSLGDAIVFIHANETDNAEAEFTGWIYANGHYYQSGSTLKVGDMTKMLVSGNGVDVRAEEDGKIYFDAVVEKDITIAGGPLASDAVVAAFTDGKIPANMTIQEVLEKLFLQEKWGTPRDPVYTFKTSVSAPTITFNKSGSVQVGTKVTCKAEEPTTPQSAIQSATITGYTFGYSLDGTSVASTPNTPYTQLQTPLLRGENNLVANFSNLHTANGDNLTSNSGTETIAYVAEGNCTYSATYTGKEVIAKTFNTQNVYNVSNLSKINTISYKTVSQTGFQASADYKVSTEGTLSAPSASASESVTGVWGYFYKIIDSAALPGMTSNDIRTWTWSVSGPNKINVGVGTYGIAIACPSGSITGIDKSNPPSPAGEKHEKSVTIDAENNYSATHPYKVYYILNTTPETAPQELTITYGN